MAVLDLEEQLVFYGAYHMHPKNVKIHIVFVPIIMFCIFLHVGGNAPTLYTLHNSIQDIPINVGTLAACCYALLYILMEPVAGGSVAPFVLGQAVLGTWCVHNYGASANWIAGIVESIGWVLQFVGHGIYERKAPALLDNLVQALFLAPFFVWMEILFKFGYRPELQHRIHEKVIVKRKALEKAAREAKEAKQANGNGASK